MLQSLFEESPQIKESIKRFLLNSLLEETQSPRIGSILKKAPTEEQQLRTRAREMFKESPQIREPVKQSLLNSILEDSQPQKELESLTISDDVFTEPCIVRKKL
jgi:hypothetical protein